MTEQEMTIAVQAAARAVWEQRMESYPPGARKPFEELGPLERVGLMETVMPLALAVAEAVLPAAQHAAWEQGADAGYQYGRGDLMGGSDEPVNPYPVVP